MYKRKSEDLFLNNDMRKVWSGMGLKSGYANKSGNSAPLVDVSVHFANELYSLYNRFDSHDFSKKIFAIPDGNMEPFVSISEQDVQSHLSRLNATKASGPDSLSARVLETCSSFIFYL